MSQSPSTSSGDVWFVEPVETYFNWDTLFFGYSLQFECPGFLFHAKIEIRSDSLRQTQRP
jgi:hypothetical protein